MTDSSKYFEFIDKYCERTIEGVSGEPLNVVSNIAFLVVSLLLLKYFRQNFQGEFLKNWDIATLIFLLFCMTLGSTLWHVYAVRWALYTDAIPILIFMNLFLLSCLFRVLNIGVVKMFLFFCAYQLFNYVIQSQFSMDTLNGSIFYLPVFVFLVGILLFVRQYRPDLYQYYVISVVLFSVSLVLRTFDVSQCDNFPLGTHFLWHTLVSIMLYFLTMSLMLASIIDKSDNTQEPHT